MAGMVAGVPHQGGATWAVLQYVLGLRSLGHDVLLVEPVAAAPPEVTAYFERVVDTFGLHDRAALVVRDARRAVGMDYAAVAEFAASADVVVNIAGMLTDAELLAPAAVRVYLDLDPAFTQLWHDVDGIDMRLAGHNRFVTVGSAVGAPGNAVPTCGVEWIPTLPPVVLQRWPVAREAPRHGLTTVANWRGYGSVEHNGVFYGQKAHSLRELMDLPRRTDAQRFDLALAIHPDERADLEALQAGGWHLVDPVAAAGTPQRYQRFVQESWAEFGVAKSGYVRSRCAWFSDRSAVYLASGRPVVAQDTGFATQLATGEGLLAFDDADGAAHAVEVVAADYQRHCRAARRLAEEHLDAARVLPLLLERIGL